MWEQYMFKVNELRICEPNREECKKLYNDQGRKLHLLRKLLETLNERG